MRRSRPSRWRPPHNTRRVASPGAKAKRLEETSKLLLDQFGRRQYKVFANNMSMDLLARDKPLPERVDKEIKKARRTAEVGQSTHPRR